MKISLSTLIYKSLRNIRDKEPARNYVGASSIGNECARAIWYQSKGFINSGLKDQLLMTFNIGHELENSILDLLNEGSKGNPFYVITDGPSLKCYDNELPMFAGTMDALIVYNDTSRAVLDVKTAKSSSFMIFKSRGLRGWNEAYYAQLQAYMGMTGVNQAALLCLNKDSSELHEEWISFDEIYYEMLKSKAKRIIESAEPPIRINNSPLFFKCNMCGFKNVCHKLK